MKRIPITVILLLIFSILYTACEKDEPDFRDVYLGTYAVTDTWIDNDVTYTANYDITLSKSAVDADGLIFSNFANRTSSVNVFIHGDDIEIPHQIIQGDDGKHYGYIGSGKISRTEILYTYQESDWDYIGNVYAVARKR